MMKNCDRGLENAARGRRPRVAFSSLRENCAVLTTKGTVFPNTDRPWPANNVFIFFLSGKLLYKKYFS